MPRDDTRVWQELRALRAAPVGQAAEDEDRRAVFAAALRQSQELADAAAVAGYATKPLALFYCLSQGVRALAAALVDDDGWRIVGHGASVTSAEPLMASRVSPKPTIRCDRRDAFSMLQAVHGLPAITEPMTLADLWRATPDTPALPDDAGGWGPLTLHFPPYSQIRERVEQEGRVELAVDGLSLDLSEEELEEALAHYPTLANGRSARIKVAQETRGYYVWDRPQIAYNRHARLLDVGLMNPWVMRSPVLTWPVVSDQGSTLDALAPTKVGGRADLRIVFPAVGGSDAPSFLALWWALLLALSSLVRYEPALWTAAIDPDRSKLAVPLEQVCDHAEGFIPAVIRDALTHVEDQP